MHYFVTGATGFVGGRVASRLLADGHRVSALVRSPEGTAARALASTGADLVAGDVTDAASVRAAMTDADETQPLDGVFHLAGRYVVGDPNPGLAERINVDGTRHVFEAMDALDVPKGVYTSTLAVNSDTNGVVVDESYSHHGPHLTEYDRTKWVAHHEVVAPMATAGVPIVTVMPGVVYGPGDTSQFGALWADYLEGAVPAIPTRTAYSWGHVDDIADAHLRAMERGVPGETYIIAGESATLVAAFDIAASATGVAAPRAVPAGVFRVLAPVAGLLERVLRLPEQYRAESLRVLGGVTYLGDNAKATRELGLTHRSLADGLSDWLTTMQTQGAAGHGEESDVGPATTPGGRAT
jgi:nucleoside-diphosphate-sugar epimerase